ncbi:hypothetical protein Taro_042023 [Colocasia esculenta]|uniref:Uncharacterized protein n=1 Tax=Colocasia esculenta TaxID=4460 RepID=A0A843WND1_COLES|nr:hypothetical protein [Colocasia esculenta]
MVYKSEAEFTSRGQQEPARKAKGRPEPRQELGRLQCNKGKATKFKRSCFGEEDDAAASAMFLLACVVCSSSSF